MQQANARSEQAAGSSVRLRQGTPDWRLKDNLRPCIRGLSLRLNSCNRRQSRRLNTRGQLAHWRLNSNRRPRIRGQSLRLDSCNRRQSSRLTVRGQLAMKTLKLKQNCKIDTKIYQCPPGRIQLGNVKL